MVQIFETLGKQLPKTGKHFKEFYLGNAFITELKENTYSDITFNAITIENNSNLKTIHRNAFNTTDQVTYYISFMFNPKLTSPDNSLFEALGKFAKLAHIYLCFNNITEIPSNAFGNVLGKKLAILFLRGKSIKKFENHALFYLKNLKFINILDTSIEYFPENAFEFKDELNETLFIQLELNKLLNSSGFSQDSLTKFKRPTSIELLQGFPYLDEKPFYRFLRANAKNSLQLTQVSLNCSDCRNYWLIREQALGYQQLILDTRIGYETKCLNGKSLNDTGNFIGCEN